MADEPRKTKVDVHVIGKAQDPEIQRQQSREPGDEMENFLQGVGYVKPPFDPGSLCGHFEDSNALSQNVAAYETNVDGFGYVLEPVVDFDSDAGRKAIRSDMELRATQEADDGEEPAEVTEKQLDEAIARMRKEAELERVSLKNFLDYIAIGISFASLRKRTRKDLEVTGNGYWEILRDEDGEIAKAVNVPSATARLMPLDPQVVEVEEKQRVGSLGWETVKIQRRFRQYVQKQEGNATPIYFKEFGDPRVVCAKNGKAYPTAEIMRHPDHEGPDAIEATEMIHFKLYSPSSAYGVPRWVGSLPSVLGSREMEEVNLAYFRNKGVPPLAILVSGGVLTTEALKRLEDVLEKEIKGKENFHKVLALEATAEPGSNASPTIKLEPLMNAVLSDAVFQKYDERNIDKVGSSFRLPRLVRGDVRDFNKSTAWASIRFAEEQVFSGEREDFDFQFNRTILVDLGTVYWRLVSKGPTVRDPEVIVDLIVSLAKASSMSPNEVRAVASRALGIELPRIEEEWAERPPAFTLSGRGYLPGEEDESPTEEQAEKLMAKAEEVSRQIVELVTKIRDGIDDEDVRRFKAQLLADMELHDSDSDEGSTPDDHGTAGTGSGSADQ